MINEKKTVAAATLGCKVNAYDTEAVLELFRDRGYKVLDFAEAADVYIVNTCTVTGISDKKSRQMIRRAAQKTPGAVIVAMGCYAQTNAGEIAKIPGVDIVCGTKDRSGIPDLVEKYVKTSVVLSTVSDYDNNASFERLTLTGLSGRQRAFLKIQEGCDNFCSYCIVPFARGPVRSRPLDDIVDEAKAVAKNGIKEVVVSGISIASYGRGTGFTLADVLNALSGVEGLKRIRLSSIGPEAVTEGFLAAIKALPKICPHFHLSLQSGSISVLKRMNRMYDDAAYTEAVRAVTEAVPQAAVVADVIAGFPGETEKEFEESYRFIETLGLAGLHVFPYSKRPGTAAAEFPGQVDKKTKDERAAKLLALSRVLEDKFIKASIGETHEVLFEKNLGGCIFEGLTPNYITVRVESDVSIVNEILPVVITRGFRGYATGCPEFSGV